MLFNPITLLPFLLLLTPTSSNPIPVPDGLILEARAGATCGSVTYTATQTNAASQKAYALYQAGTTLGSGAYPHTYNNYEGFTFAVDGPYQEFPILSSGAIYSGESPGADRVVINTSGKQAGTITHTGASGNNFLQCT
ncbi:putative extracellular guanyl-specific ribonuclease RntA [Calycina marina]|uniref:ribonuclease T1 n=1 Tax=Calycina marina TaxID=1763456 RepID=A0A9P7ZA21_9HELO|nr:putative extracellular guanyl-specific ribonuclease RntA [Calycina marina]